MFLYRDAVYLSIERERDQTLYGSEDCDREALRFTGNDLADALAVRDGQRTGYESFVTGLDQFR